MNNPPPFPRCAPPNNNVVGSAPRSGRWRVTQSQKRILRHFFRRPEALNDFNVGFGKVRGHYGRCRPFHSSRPCLFLISGPRDCVFNQGGLLILGPLLGVSIEFGGAYFLSSGVDPMSVGGGAVLRRNMRLKVGWLGRDPSHKAQTLTRYCTSESPYPVPRTILEFQSVG